MSATAFLNARLIDPASGLDETGGLLAIDGRIAEVGAQFDIPDDAERIDCGGHVLAPGIVDMRSFAVDAASALAGGITTVVLMPDQSPPLDSAAMIEYVAKPDPAGLCPRVRPMGAATRDLEGGGMAELGLMSEAGAVGFTDGRKAIADALVMRRLLEYARELGRPIMQHAEESSLAADGAMNEGETATRLGLPGIPSTAEAIMIERDVHLARLTGGRVHVAQVSASLSLDVLRKAKASGVSVTCGASPQHFILNETAVGDYRTFAKVSPPLRGEADRAALAAAIAEGLIDVLCSGHEPRDQDAKRLPFSEAAPGIVGYETLLPLALNLSRDETMSMADVLALLTDRPARLLGLEAGRLAPGLPADLMLFDPDRPWCVAPDTLHSETQNTPFAEMPVQGRVLRTVIAGRTVFVEAAG